MVQHHRPSAICFIPVIVGKRLLPTHDISIAIATPVGGTILPLRDHQRHFPDGPLW